MKSTISMTIDTDVLVEARAKRINLSGFFNEALRSQLGLIKETEDDDKELELISLKTRLAVLEQEKRKEEEKQRKMTRRVMEI
jgi:post-segregation antitoxin (ccd killing protein)